MIICEQPKIIFLAVPRTASTAITASIAAAFPGCEKFGQHSMRLPRRCRSGEYFIFAGARNPYSRIVSHYLYRHRYHAASAGQWTFKEYLYNMVRTRLHWWGLSNDPSALEWVSGTGCTEYIRFEHLHSDWAALPPWQETGIVPELKMRNANPGTYNWRLFYTDELARMVYLHQAADFEYFGYDRDSWRLGFVRHHASEQAA